MRSRLTTSLLAVVVIAASVACNGQQSAATISVSPSEARVATGETVAFSAQVVNASPEDVVWSATCGSFQAQTNPTIYTAPTTPGTCQVVATAQSGRGPSDVAIVIVEPKVSVTVDPPEAEVVVEATATFSASVEHADDTGVTWTTTCGAIVGSGSTVTYQAPTTPGSCLVTATSVQDSSASGTAVVTVVESPPQGDTSVNVTVIGPGRVVQGSFECSGSCVWTGDGSEAVTFEAAPDAGNVLVAWGGVCPVLAEDCTQTFEDGDAITVTFAPHALRLHITGDGEGEFRIQGPEIDLRCTKDCAVGLQQALSLSITYFAHGSTGTVLDDWGGACAGANMSNYCLVPVEGATDVSKTWRHPPVAIDDSYDTTRNTTLTVGAANGVLANDDDTPGDTLAAERVTDVTYGTLALAADGGFTYTPDPDFDGSDAFTYRARDAFGNLSNTATATITVTNSPP